MATYANGRPVNPRIGEALSTHESVEVLWWRHNLASGPSFIRQLELGNPRQQSLDEDDLVVLSDTCEYRGSEHGHRMVYHAASRAELAEAHPKCASCRGEGVRTLTYSDGISVSSVCECCGGRMYWALHLGTLRKVDLRHFNVVVIATDRGWDWLRRPQPGEYVEVEAELIGRYTSSEAAEAEAARRRLEDRFQPGESYGRGHIIGIRVVERPLPTWV